MKTQILRTVSIVIALLMLLAACPSMAFAATKWIDVSTIEQLYNIRNDLTANYRLVNDIDLTAATAKGGDWDFMGNGWNPIGSNNIYTNEAFTGTFDGNGYAIRGLRIEQTTLPAGTDIIYVGLFANVAGTVKNLAVYGSVNSQSGRYVGGIAAYAYGGTIENCQNNATVTISHSSNAYMGGIVGGGNGTTINQCVNTGAITSLSTYPGPDRNIGGIAGWLQGASTVSNCYNTGDIASYEGNGTDYVGGIVGYYVSDDKIQSCYNRGQTANNQTSIGYSIAYVSKGTVTDCYYLADTGSNTSGSTSLTPAQMKLQSLYSDFDFEAVWVLDTDSLYPYPQLRNNMQDVATMVDITFGVSTFETTHLSADDTFKINITTSEIDDIACVEFKLGFDPTKFEFVSGEAAGYLAEMDMSNIEAIDESVWTDPTKAEVWVTGMHMSAMTGAEDEVIATLTFKALTTIDSDCEFVAVATPLAIDSSDNEYLAAAINGGIEIVTLIGDINGDYTIDMRDAFEVYRAASSGQVSENVRLFADMNGDGAIDMRDAFKVYRIASGQVTV